MLLVVVKAVSRCLLKPIGLGKLSLAFNDSHGANTSSTGQVVPVFMLPRLVGHG